MSEPAKENIELTIINGLPYINGREMQGWVKDLDLLMAKHSLTSAAGVTMLAWRLGVAAALHDEEARVLADPAPSVLITVLTLIIKSYAIFQDTDELLRREQAESSSENLH
jgi:hypothetical protein